MRIVSESNKNSLNETAMDNWNIYLHFDESLDTPKNITNLKKLCGKPVL